MKELSIEEKAKRYDEALERMKSWARGEHPECFTEAQKAAEFIFPELKESEDERVRKALIKLVKKTGEGYENVIDGVSIENAIAWLEKLGEQKLNPVLDIEIPFGAKDSELQEASYYIPEGFHAEIESNRVIIKKGEQKPTEEYNITGIKSKHAQGKLGEMIKKLEIEKQSEQKSIKEHNACEFCEDRYGCVSPCSMKLVEKEKLTEVEPKFKVGQTIKKEGFNLGFIIVKIEDGFYYNNMGDYFPFTDQDNWQLVEQNPAWSEEDEDYYDAIIAKLEVTQEDALLTDNQMNFLKSLKDKYVPQSKIEWSEEDKNMLQSILDEYKSMPTEKRNWLKSLKDRVQPQPVWSKEDDKTLCRCISATFDHGYLKECNWLKSKFQWELSDKHYELEEFAKIVRCNLTGISKAVQELFEAKYLQLTGNKMYEGFKD